MQIPGLSHCQRAVQKFTWYAEWRGIVTLIKKWEHKQCFSWKPWEPEIPVKSKWAKHLSRDDTPMFIHWGVKELCPP